MVAEEVTVSLSGGAPWGFRLQGGAEHQKPLQVAKIRRRSKACRAGLKEDDELVAIEEHNCMELSHAQAMSLIDMQRSTLNLKVKRISSLSDVLAPPCSSSMRVLSPPAVSLPTWGPPRCITSPPDSEAYYGETDSDADTQTPTHIRRPRRTPPHPHARSPARHDSQSQEETETSEMSGYESAPDGGVPLQGHTWEQGPAALNGSSLLPGVPRREVVYQPPQNEEWLTSAHTHTPHTLTPHTLTQTPTDQGGLLGEGEGEVDSGFQEAGAYLASAVPLVSPERANEALMLGFTSQLVPMVGPQQTPVSDDLSTTYVEKARQAKLQRGESVVEKQVKEARTKCRSIASLLTDSPNPNSKGVLMFKKRRQRAKKYTLTCFGKAEGDTGTETEGETEEEGGSSFLSGSEVDEDGFSAAFDSTWDSGYLETLDRKSSACPSATATTPYTPLTNHSLGLDTSAYQSPGFEHSVNLSPRSEYAGVDGSAYPGLRSEINGWDQPIGAGPYHNSAQMSPPAVSMYNGGSVAVSRANVVLSPPAYAAPPNHSELHQNHYPGPNPGPANPAMNSDSALGPNPGGNLNRTARPFTPFSSLSRSSVAPVLFRPPQPRPASVTTATRPAAAVSMVNIPPPRQPSSGPESRRSVSSASLYISPRNGNGGSSVYSPPMVHSPTASLASAPFSHPPANPLPFSPEHAAQAAQFSPPPSAQPLSPAAQGPPPVYPSPAQAFTPHPPPSSGMYAPPFPPSQPPAPAQVYVPAPQQVYVPAPQQAYVPAPQQVYVPAPQPPPAPSQAAPPPPPAFFNPYANMAAPVTQQPPAAAALATTAPPQAPPPTADSLASLASREQRVSVPAARTGILAEARRRSNQKKPMFCSVQNKNIDPNPALLSMLQNMDQDPDPVPSAPSFAGLNGSGPVHAGEAGGHESGPEEDWLRLGAEACNFMQAQKGPRPPPVAPKPQAPQAPPQLAGKGGQLFARRQSRMDRYMEERSPSVASAAPYSPAQPRDASPTPSLPATWRYNSTCRAPPPINYNPLLSPSCPLKAQKTQKAGVAKPAPGGSKAGGRKAALSAVDIMSHQPYQLNSSLFTYGGGVPQNASQAPGSQVPMKTARVREVKRFSTPPPMSTGPSVKVITPRSATTLGEPLWRSDDDFGRAPPAPAPYQVYQPPPPQVSAAPYQPQPQWGATPLSPPQHPPAPTGPLPQLPTFSSPAYPSAPTFSHLQQADSRQFKSTPNMSPLGPNVPSRPVSSIGGQVPRPRFSTSNLGLQPCVWRPGSNM